MRLYTRTGAVALDDPEFGHFAAGDDGSFDFPDELSDRLHGFHAAGKPLWETDVERQARFMHEELERRKDPATLLAAVEELTRRASGAPAPVVATEGEPTVAKPKTPRKTAAKPSPRTA